MKRKASGCIAGLMILLAANASPAAAQDTVDGVTGFPRQPLHVSAWPDGKKVAVSFTCSSKRSALARGRLFDRISWAATPIS